MNLCYTNCPKSLLTNNIKCNPTGRHGRLDTLWFKKPSVAGSNPVVLWRGLFPLKCHLHCIHHPFYLSRHKQKDVQKWLLSFQSKPFSDSVPENCSRAADSPALQSGTTGASYDRCIRSICGPQSPTIQPLYPAPMGSSGGAIWKAHGPCRSKDRGKVTIAV